MIINALEKNRKFSLILTIIIAVEIFLFSEIPQKVISGAVTSTSTQSILYHFVIFFLLTFFLFITLKQEKPINWKIVFVTLMISIIYAILDEVHQIFTPGRFAGIGDVLVDSIGSIFAIISYKTIKKLG